MEVNSLYFVLGAGGAVLATLLLVVLEDLWLQNVLPLWRRWWYRGVNISGAWKGLGNAQIPAPGEWTEVGLTLDQQTRELRGLLWIRHCSGEGSTELRVPLAGRISDGHVTLAPSADGEAPGLLATALLKIEGRGSALNGQLLYRDAVTGAIEIGRAHV